MNGKSAKKIINIFIQEHLEATFGGIKIGEIVSFLGKIKSQVKIG